RLLSGAASRRHAGVGGARGARPPNRSFARDEPGSAASPGVCVTDGLTRTVTVLFLGASRLVGLLQRFHAAAEVESVDLRILSVEDASAWHAIAVSGLAETVP